MSWMELIELRAAGRNLAQLESRLKYLMENAGRNSAASTITTYKRYLLDTDFSIHIDHVSGPAAAGGSPLGLQIVSALKEFGLVKHSIWIRTEAENE